MINFNQSAPTMIAKALPAWITFRRGVSTSAKSLKIVATIKREQ
jgi:hypothetical protein